MLEAAHDGGEEIVAAGGVFKRAQAGGLAVFDGGRGGDIDADADDDFALARLSVLLRFDQDAAEFGASNEDVVGPFQGNGER